MSGEPQQEECPLCQQTAARIRKRDYGQVRTYECPFCGEFAVTSQVHGQLRDMEPRDRARVSAYTRRMAIRGVFITILVRPPGEQEPRYENAVTLQDVLDDFPRTISQRLDRALLNIALLSETPGELVKLDEGRDYATLYAENRQAMHFMAKALEDGGYAGCSISSTTVVLNLRPLGWDQVAELQRGAGRWDSLQAFVAMWFAHEVEEAWTKGIKPGIKDAGFDPLRINLKEHNEKICDVIIAEIRRSRFVVADVTGQRQGVYFEGGFAMGLGIPVIWMCRQDEIDKCHFDTRQYNHVLWQTSEDLRQKLLRRIEATIPSSE